MELNVLNFYASISKKKKLMYNFSLLLFLFILSECCRITILVRANLEKKFANSIKVRLVESSVIFSIIVSLWLIIASRLDHLRSKQFSINQFEGGFEEGNNWTSKFSLLSSIRFSCMFLLLTNSVVIQFLPYYIFPFIPSSPVC